MKAEEFFAKLAKIDGKEASMDFIFETLDTMLYAGEFKNFNIILAKAAMHVDELPDRQLIGLLVISRWGRKKLPFRIPFLRACRRKFDKTRPKDTEALLKGLE